MMAPDGTRYTVAGPEEAPAVALIHGLGLARGVWDGVRAALSGFRVISYDLYGHGESAPSPARAASLAGLADQLAGLMDHVGVARAHIVGFSIGGMINRRFALDRPDRVASLVIMNAPHDRGAVAQAQVEDRAREVRRAGPMATMDAALARWFTPEALACADMAPEGARGEGAAALHPAERVRAWRQQAEPESYAGAAWVLAHGVRELIAPDPPIASPALVMTCENDSGSTPEMSRAIAAEIAGAELWIVPRLRHLGLMEEPLAFAAPLRGFLDRHAA